MQVSATSLIGTVLYVGECHQSLLGGPYSKIYLVHRNE